MKIERLHQGEVLLENGDEFVQWDGKDFYLRHDDLVYRGTGVVAHLDPHNPRVVVQLVDPREYQDKVLNWEVYNSIV